MKIIDENGRLFKKISVLDIIIVLALVLLIISFVYSRINNDGASSASGITVSNQEVNFSSQIKAYSIPETEISPFSVGDNIYSNDGALLGKIVSVDKKQTTVKTRLQTGKYVDSVYYGYYDYFITVEGKGTQTEKGIMASGSIAVIPNNSLIISSKLFNGNAIVLSVQKS